MAHIKRAFNGCYVDGVFGPGCYGCFQAFMMAVDGMISRQDAFESVGWGVGVVGVANEADTLKIVG